MGGSHGAVSPCPARTETRHGDTAPWLPPEVSGSARIDFLRRFAGFPPPFLWSRLPLLCNWASTVSPPSFPIRRRVSPSPPPSGWVISWRKSRWPTRSAWTVFGVGEHHRPEFLDSAPTIILAAAAGPHPAHPAGQRCHGAQRGGPRAGVPGVRHARPALAGPRRDRRRTRLLHRSLPALWPSLGGLRFAVHRKARPAPETARGDARALEGPAPARASPARGCIRAHCRTPCRSGSAWAARRSPSCAPGGWGCP